MRAFFLFIIILLALPIILKISYWTFTRSKRAQAVLQKACKEQIYWNLYLRFGLEGFLELSLVSLCRIRVASIATRDDVILTAFAFIMYSLLVFFMVYSGLFLHQNHHMINQKQFKNRYGALSEGLNETDKTLMFFPTIFMLRRLSVAFIIVYMQDKSFFQIQLIAFLSSLVMVYQGIYKPQQSKTHNRVEMFNEVMNLLSTYPLFLFTDFVLDKEAQYSCGWAMIIITVVIISGNLAVILKTTFKHLA